MRIAIVSDIHGNLTAFEAVLADLRDASPDLILHGGDLAESGPGGPFIIDHIRDAAWPGVIGNSDQMLADPDSLERFAAQSPQLDSLWRSVREVAAHARELLGSDRIAWLGELPLAQLRDDLALVHASPGDPWRAPNANAAEAELAAAYSPLARPRVIYGHLHTPFVRALDAFTVANSGSVSLPYDGDPRASYLLIDNGAPQIRRAAYDVDLECRRLVESRFPHAEWIARALQTARPAMP